jgi:CubicO group peptidase (beta-lactamase class C family)
MRLPSSVNCQLLALALCCLTAPAPVSAQEIARDHRVVQALTFLEMWLDGQRAYEGIPGISAAVVHDQQVIWKSGMGLADRERSAAASPSTVYSVCSISKLFTSVAVMQLRDEGRLRLDDPVARHLPWFKVKQMHDDSGSITIESLLTHSAGFQEDPSIPFWSGSFTFPTREEVMATLPSEETIYAAQRHYEYSNLGLFLAGEVTTAAAGTPYADRVQAKILEPLGLVSTFPEMPAGLRGTRLATGYSSRGRDGARRVLPFFQTRGMAPAAGFASTAEDLARFLAWQFRLLGRGGSEILNANTLREMQRVHFIDPDWKTTRGLGFRVWRAGEQTFAGHSGDCPGFRSALQIQAEDRIGTVFLSNAGGVASENFAQQIHEIVAPAIRAAVANKEAGQAPDLSLARFQGSYDFSPWGGEMLVFPWEDGLALVDLPTSQPMADLVRLRAVPGSPGRFRRVRENGVLGEPFDFVIDAAGRVTDLKRWNNPFPRIQMR